MINCLRKLKCKTIFGLSIMGIGLLTKQISSAMPVIYLLVEHHVYRHVHALLCLHFNCYQGDEQIDLNACGFQRSLKTG